MSSEDRINELYDGKLWDEETQRRARDRVHWICSHAEGPHVLDLGCSQGIVSVLMAREGLRVLGADIRPEAIDYARGAAEAEPPTVRERLRFVVGDEASVEVPDGGFSTVVLGEVIEHQTNPGRLLARVREVLRPNGTLVLTTPFGVHPDPDHKVTFYLGDLAELLGSLFEVTELGVADKYIRAVARKSQPGIRVAVDEILHSSQAAFREAEDRYIGQRTRLVERVDKLQERIDKLQIQADELKELKKTLAAERRERSELQGALGAAEQQVRDRDAARERAEAMHARSLEEAREAGRREVAAAAARLRDLEREHGKRAAAWQKREHELLKSVRDTRLELSQSTPFQLGWALVQAAKHPRELAQLPLRLASLGRKVFDRKLARSESPSAAEQPRQTPEPAVVRAEPQQTKDAYGGGVRVSLTTAKPVNRTRGRVLHFLEYSLPHKQNGYTLRSINLMTAQRALGLEPWVLTAPGFPRNCGVDVWPTEEIVHGITHLRLAGDALADTSDAALTKYIDAYAREAARIIERVQPEILHAASDFKNAYAALQLGRAYSLPVVYEVRGVWEESRIANGRLERTSPHYARLRRIEDYCMQQASVIVTLGEAMKAEIVGRGVEARRVFVVPNGVDAERIDRWPRDPDLTAELGLGGKSVIGYIGSVSGLEHLEVLLRALPELRRYVPDVAALVVGDGDDVERLQQLAQQLGIANDVRFTGRVPHDRVADYYAQLDVVVCCRDKDRVSELVTPLKPLEAMAYGKPTVVSDLPALRELVHDESTGLTFRPGDYVDLAIQLKRVLTDSLLRDTLVQQAETWVRRERSWQAVAKTYEAAYRAAAGASRSGARVARA
jgi:PEP-CTERM/exosortase A-associated glycosyltransferase